jgi:RloB-like protein
MAKSKSNAPQRPFYSARRVNTREPRPRFLIVCEGTKTEPHYFAGFNLGPRVVPVGLGYNTVSLVQEAIQLQAEYRADQVWCVLDCDEYAKDQFNAALALAQQHHIQVAYSNPAFELWYLLHYHYINTGIGRGEYLSRLGKNSAADTRKAVRRCTIYCKPCRRWQSETRNGSWPATSRATPGKITPRRRCICWSRNCSSCGAEAPADSH